jgi:hypothetical protein
MQDCVTAPDQIGTVLRVFEAPICNVIWSSAPHLVGMCHECRQLGIHCFSPMPARRCEGMKRATQAGEIRNAVSYLTGSALRNAHVPLRRALPERDVLSKPGQPLAVGHFAFGFEEHLTAGDYLCYSLASVMYCQLMRLIDAHREIAERMWLAQIGQRADDGQLRLIRV